MKKEYVINDVEYASLYDARQASGILFGENPSDEDLAKIGIDVIYSAPTPDEKARTELAVAKAKRAEAVAGIKVTVDGMVFDGDEDSQTRMSRAISASTPTEKTAWVLADNSVAEVTREQLQKALRLAGEEQTKLWVLPYTADAASSLPLRDPEIK